MTTTLARTQHRPLSLTNAEIAAGAGIEYSKLELTGAIVAGDIVSVDWSQITGKPTTLPGYGITTPITPAQGGTGTATVFTAGSVVFAGASGVYSQDNTHLFFDDANNRLGIGTAAPDTLLHVHANTAAVPGSLPAGNIIHLSAADATTARVLLDAFGGGSAFSFRRSNGTAGTPSAVTVDGTIGTFNFLAYGATGYSATARGALTGFAAETWTDSAQGCYFTFNTTPTGSTTIAERMRLSDRGNLLLGTTAQPSTGEAALIFGDGTSPATMGSNTAGLYANDVAGTVNLYGINEAGTVTQLTGLTAAYTPTNVTTDRSYNANATTVDEIADVLGTLIADLQARGICG